MSEMMIAGPIRTIAGPGGTNAPFYVVPFDKRGVCVGPQTLDRLVDDAQKATDVFVFSHGWNNVWDSAMRHYDTFISNFVKLRADFAPDLGRPFQPLLTGVFWPSAALVTDDEEGPGFAGGGTGDRALLPDVLALADELDAQDAAALCRELDRPVLNADQALTVARLLAPVLARTADDLGAPPPTPEELLEAWRAVEASRGTAAPTQAAGGFVDDDEGDDGAAPQAAGFLDNLKPRNLVRLASVLLMKDRAGTVGASGLSGLLRQLRTAVGTDGRIHLIGHSYGCRVLMSALCAPDDAHAVTVDSALLLQPAISCYCFAPAGGVPGTGQAGGYHAAISRCKGPVVCTFSSHDVALTKFFHLAARRAADLGEARIAGQPPSRYAALGGYGPQGVAARSKEPVRPPATYGFGGRGVVGLRADTVIGGHGDVTGEAAAWMLLNQVRG